MTLSIEDRMAIQEVLGRYYQLLDGNTEVSVESVFGDGASLSVPTAEFPDRAAIAAFFDKRPPGAGKAGRHFITNLVIDEETEGQALAQFYLLYVDVSAGPVLKMTGNGRSTMARDAKGWRIRRFVIAIDPSKSKG